MRQRINLLDKLISREFCVEAGSSDALYRIMSNDIYSSFLYTVREIDRNFKGDKPIAEFGLKAEANLKHRMSLSYIELGHNEYFNAYTFFSRFELERELHLILGRLEPETRKIKRLKAAVVYTRSNYIEAFKTAFFKVAQSLEEPCFEPK